MQREKQEQMYDYGQNSPERLNQPFYNKVKTWGIDTR
jgi:hypothetical protein